MRYPRSWTPFLYLPSENMTHRKWTTDKQEEWLDEQKATFMEANQRKAAAKEFFPTVCKDFRTKWTVLSVTEDEIKEAGSTELATKRKREACDKVRAHHYRIARN